MLRELVFELLSLVLGRFCIPKIVNELILIINFQAKSILGQASNMFSSKESSLL